MLARADRLLAARRWSEAADAYRLALRSREDHPDAWFNLGYVLNKAGQFAPAVAAYGRALAHGVQQPEVAHLNRAAILSDHLRRDADALVELQTALAVAPGFGPALLNLGNLHEERAERAQAAGCYRRLIEADVDDGVRCLALARLLQLDPPKELDDPLLRRAQGATQQPLVRSDLATLLFAIAHALDRLGEIDAAFATFARAKRCAHGDGSRYDAAAAYRRTRALVESPCPVRPAPATHRASPQPVFICGMFRSGSTLLEQVLAGHPDIAAGGELDLLPRLVAGPLAPYPASLRTLDDRAAARLAAGYLEAVRARLPDDRQARRYVTDKRPDNYLLLGLAKRMFPGAKILHTVRHPLDTGLSIFMQHLNPRAFDYAGTLADIGHHYGEYRRLMDHWKHLYPGDVFDFDYDAFVLEPEAALRPLLDFLDLPWHADCLAFHTLGNTVKTASYWQVREPLHARASGRWQRYRRHLGPLQEALEAQGVALPRADTAAPRPQVAEPGPAR